MADAAFSILNDVFFSLSPPSVSFTLHRLHKLPLSLLSALRWEGGKGEPFATSWDEKGRKGGGGEKGGGGVIYYTKTHAAPSRRLQGDPFPAAILAPRVGRRGEGGGFHVRVGVGLRPNEREEKRRGRKGAFKKVDSRGGRRGRRGCSLARSFRLSLPPLFSPPPGKGKSIP